MELSVGFLYINDIAKCRKVGVGRTLGASPLDPTLVVKTKKNIAEFIIKILNKEILMSDVGVRYLV